MNFSGKIAIVTGSAVGIGADCVRELLKNDIKGVVIADINPKLGEETSKKFNDEFGKGKTVFVTTNIGDKDSFEGAFKKAVEVYGHIDILVNNAGIFDEINWERAIKINVIGTTNGCLLAINKYFPKYRSTPQTYILNVSSMGGVSPVNYCPHYTSSKYAVTGLSRAFGINSVVEKDGVCVMCLCPGATDTAIFDDPKIVYRDLYDAGIKTFKFQKPESVAKGIVEVLRQPEHGSLWVVNENVLHKVKLPEELQFTYSKNL